MKTRIAVITLALLATFALPTQITAQNQVNNSNSEDIPQKFWIATTPGGEYMVALSRITDIAIHEYIANGTARVYEVNVSGGGSLLARFYYLEAVTDKSPLNVGQVVIDRLKSTTEEIGERTGAADSWKKVVKDYPNTTHARTAEFRLDRQSNVQSLYDSVKGAWMSGKGKHITISSSVK
jgi:hypothetical protein